MKQIFLLAMFIPNLSFAGSLVCHVSIIVKDGTELSHTFHGQHRSDGIVALNETFDISNEQFTLRASYTPAQPCGNTSIHLMRTLPSELMLLSGKSPLCSNQGFEAQSLVSTPAFHVICRE